jgi:hypothetical protein
MKIKEYIISGNYGQGWEELHTEETLAEAKQRLKEYRENEPEYAHKLKIKNAKR